MKNIIYILLFFTQIAFGQSFDKGNEFYRNGDYAAAVTQYENVIKSKKESAELYFNLANAYYKLNKVGPAIYNYEKALMLNPLDGEVKNNLLFAQKMQIDEVKTLPKSGIGKAVSDITSLFRYDLWAWIAIGFALLILASFTGYYFSRVSHHKRIYFIAMMLASLLLAISIASAAHQKNIYINDRPAIVFASQASVKNEPSAAGAEAFVLHEGTKVAVLEELEKFKKIALADGNEGWIEAAAIKELK